MTSVWASVVDAHLQRLPATHRLLTGGAEEGGDRPDLRARPHASTVRAAPGATTAAAIASTARTTTSSIREKPRARAHFTSQEVTSVFSPSPPGAPSAP